jgi:hypothetical protein
MRDGNDSQFTNDSSGQDPDSSRTSANRLEQALGGRPLMVYLVLFAGAGALLVLLLIVWISATGGGGEEEHPICLDISVADAQTAILAGEVSRVDIVVDRQHPDVGPTAVQLELTDKSCRRLPTGADNRDAAYQVVGVVYVYNSTGEQRIRINTKREDVPNEFLVTSTALPTETATLEPTVPPTETLVPPPTETFTPEPTHTATVEPTITLPPTQTFAPTELSPTT